MIHHTKYIFSESYNCSDFGGGRGRGGLADMDLSVKFWDLSVNFVGIYR